MSNTHGPVHQADDDHTKRVITTTEARQGVVSGRVVTVLFISTVVLAIIFAIIWLTSV